MNEADPSPHPPIRNTTVGGSVIGQATMRKPRAAGDETLDWLAGHRMPGTVAAEEGLLAPVDTVLSEQRPDDPVEAAARRAAILGDLRRKGSADPRVRRVFEVDPVVAEGGEHFVTRGMLNARLDLFDAVLTMLGEPVLSPAMRSRAMLTLKGAYAALSDAAQAEWMQSEVRLEEAKCLLATRSQDELNRLGEQLASIFRQTDIWPTTRAFTLAAHIGTGASKLKPENPLEMRDLA